MEGQSCCQNELLVFLPHNFAFGAALSLADREILQRAFESQRWIMTSKYANYFTVGRSTRVHSIALELDKSSSFVWITSLLGHVPGPGTKCGA
jgi:hypothetical protein